MSALSQESHPGQDEGKEQYEHRQQSRSDAIEYGTLLVEAEANQSHDDDRPDYEQADGASVSQNLANDPLSDGKYTVNRHYSSDKRRK